MIPTVLALTLALVSSFSTTHAQGDVSSANNMTDLEGTWSSGSGAVRTGGVSLSDPYSISHVGERCTGGSLSTCR